MSALPLKNLGVIECISHPLKSFREKLLLPIAHVLP